MATIKIDLDRRIGQLMRMALFLNSAVDIPRAG